MSEDSDDQKPKLQLVTKESIGNLTDSEAEALQKNPVLNPVPIVKIFLHWRKWPGNSSVPDDVSVKLRNCF